MLRKKEPNKNYWNGVGGHLENGETPYQSMLREIQEETGIHSVEIQFGGILTWQGFAIPPGGLYIFTADVSDKNVVENGEGRLAWHPRQFAFTAAQVVGNIHHFLPPVLAGAGPFHYHFNYHQGSMISRNVQIVPDWVNIHQPFFL